MKSLKIALALMLALSALLASESVLARGHGHVRFGVFVGAPLYWPGYYPPYYSPYYYPPYYPPVVTVPAAPPTYIEQNGPQTQSAPAPQQSNWWYYCADAKAYYPYVKECPAGWQRVSPQPQS
jgi:hypothetical protein